MLLNLHMLSGGLQKIGKTNTMDTKKWLQYVLVYTEEEKKQYYNR